jgi:hypothetical protein
VGVKVRLPLGGRAALVGVGGRSMPVGGRWSTNAGGGGRSTPIMGGRGTTG